jgi:uncharacterized protein YkwD
MKHLLFVLALCVATTASAVDFTNDITPDNVLRLMNDYRADRDLPPLHADAKLTSAAEDRMRDMEDGGWWGHESPEGISPFVWLAARDYRFASAGENLASGFETAKLLVASWMESPGHRENIMGAEYDECGIAIIEGSTRGPANGKSVVVLFGRKR